jgi:hypothetical protein
MLSGWPGDAHDAGRSRRADAGQALVVSMLRGVTVLTAQDGMSLAVLLLLVGDQVTDVTVKARCAPPRACAACW